MRKPSMLELLKFISGIVEPLGMTLNSLIACHAGVLPKGGVDANRSVLKYGIALGGESVTKKLRELDYVIIVTELNKSTAFEICREVFKWFPTLAFVNLTGENTQDNSKFTIFAVY